MDIDVQPQWRELEETYPNMAEEELESLALEGLNSGPALEIGPGYWEEKHRRLDERLTKYARTR